MDQTTFTVLDKEPLFDIPSPSPQRRVNSTPIEYFNRSMDYDNAASYNYNDATFSNKISHTPLANTNYENINIYSPEQHSTPDEKTPKQFYKNSSYGNYNLDSKFPLFSEKIYNKNKKVLVLDLDETLVHARAFLSNPTNYDNFLETDLFLKIDFKDEIDDIFVNKRPHLEIFLDEMGKYYNLVVFTASQKEYANPLLNLIETNKTKFTNRFFRDNCTINANGFYVKDLSILKVNLKDVILLDNNAVSYEYNPQNGIPITTWLSDRKDNELMNYIDLLKFLSDVEDVRQYIPRFVINGKVDFYMVEQMIFNEEQKKVNNYIKYSRINSDFKTNRTRKVYSQSLMGDIEPRERLNNSIDSTITHDYSNDNLIRNTLSLVNTINLNYNSNDNKLQEVKPIPSLKDNFVNYNQKPSRSRSEYENKTYNNHILKKVVENRKDRKYKDIYKKDVAVTNKYAPPETAKKSKNENGAVTERNKYNSDLNTNTISHERKKTFHKNLNIYENQSENDMILHSEKKKIKSRSKIYSYSNKKFNNSILQSQESGNFQTISSNFVPGFANYTNSVSNLAQHNNEMVEIRKESKNHLYKSTVNTNRKPKTLVRFESVYNPRNEQMKDFYNENLDNTGTVIINSRSTTSKNMKTLIKNTKAPLKEKSKTFIIQPNLFMSGKNAVQTPKKKKNNDDIYSEKTDFTENAPKLLGGNVTTTTIYYRKPLLNSGMHIGNEKPRLRKDESHPLNLMTILGNIDIDKKDDADTVDNTSAATNSKSYNISFNKSNTKAKSVKKLNSVNKNNGKLIVNV